MPCGGCLYSLYPLVLKGGMICRDDRVAQYLVTQEKIRLGGEDELA